MRAGSTARLAAAVVRTARARDAREHAREHARARACAIESRCFSSGQRSPSGAGVSCDQHRSSQVHNSRAGMEWRWLVCVSFR
eukprot:142461-Pleurochrysis_carterae.AAC.2